MCLLTLLIFLRRYGAVKDISDNNFIPSKIPEGCVPIHLNLVVTFSTIYSGFYWLGMCYVVILFDGEMYNGVELNQGLIFLECLGCD